MPLPIHNQQELVTERCEIWDGAKKLLEKTRSENRAFTAEENEEWKRRLADLDAIEDRIDVEQQASAIEKRFETLSVEAPRIVASSTASQREDQYASAFDRFLRTGNALELASMGTGTPADGGYAVSSPVLGTIIEFLEGNNPMRGLVEVVSASSPFSVPRELAKPTVSGVAELDTVLESQAQLTQSTFVPFTQSRVTRVSLQLLADAAFDITNYVTRSLGKASGKEEERYLVNGTGSSEPEGILTGASEGATGGAISYAGINSLIYSVEEDYANAGTFVSSREVKGAVAALTADGRPIFNPSPALGEPDTVLGRPYVSSQWMPANSNGNKILAFGDFKRAMWLADFGPQSIQRLDELYAGTNEVGFKIYHRFDSRVVDERAVKWYRRTS